MPEHFADRLCAAIKEKGTPACVGLDPVFDRLPKDVLNDVGDWRSCPDIMARKAVGRFCEGVIRAVAPLVPAIKLNSAFFEAHGSEGLGDYFKLISYARESGLIVIGDIKRGDVGHSTEAYALAHLSSAHRLRGPDESAPDAVTVNSYLGLDGVNPFLRVSIEEGKGVFALVQTSNDSAAEIQGARLASGDTVALLVARLVSSWAGTSTLMGRSGYSALGAVVSPRDGQSTEELRVVLGHSILLVPGYGAQGKAAEDVAACFNSDGMGAIVNASRSVIYTFNDPRYRTTSAISWQSCVEAACRDFVRDVNTIVEMRTGG